MAPAVLSPVQADVHPNVAAGGAAAAARGGGAGGAKTIEETYQKLSQLEHILLRPDTYIGSPELTTTTRKVWDATAGRVVERDVTYAPGLYKIFDEILVNAADHKHRDASMSALKVDIDPENNRVSVWNNGAGIPVAMHAKEGVYVPELIFGHLLTSSNYDDGEKKVVGGRNGYGAKLANIFSTRFVVETADASSGKTYKQTFKRNMMDRGTPAIRASAKPRDTWTRITFEPDLAKFGMDSLNEDAVAVLQMRVVDMAGVVPGIAVYLNGTKLKINSFKQYVDLHLADAPDAPRIHDATSGRWEVVVSLSDGQLTQTSFVNSIATTKGGTHVNHVADQLVSRIQEHIAKKHKTLKVKPFQIKSQLSIYVKCLVENPAFDSQTKEMLTSRPASFGSKWVCPDRMAKDLIKSGVVESVLSLAESRQVKELAKTDGGKRARVSGIPKLDDANLAGTRDSAKCTLILTEGDSAKALAISGLSVVGRDYYGVFPLRGKLLNVREATHKQIMDNAEITNLKKIIGLQHGKKYDATSIKSLRYGHVLIMTDQDHDGSHIKGLLVNMFHHFWPTLLQFPNFLEEFITPIVRVTRKGVPAKLADASARTFYTIPEFQTWVETTGRAISGWKVKYYKGLGTSTAAEAKAYFSDLNRHQLTFQWSGAGDSEMIDLAFSKLKIAERKTWLANYVPGTFFDHAADQLTYSNFINKELILFSMHDNERSIPSVIDGFKPSQRKVLYACFKRKLRAEIKVVQLAGYVSEHAAYHHGEASLQATIVGLAQNFVGANNINLLTPDGQFGTRLAGGKDAASSRYIFTRLAPIARAIFPEADDALLDYLEDDGKGIEPKWYCPIIPMVLVNGADGIGTGWSTTVPCYNPADLIANVRRLLKGESVTPMQPWYRGFTGTVSPVQNAPTFDVHGVVSDLGDGRLQLSELPIRTWTSPYKEWLESMIVGVVAGADTAAEGGGGGRAKAVAPFLKDVRDMSSENRVSFTLSLSDAEHAATLAAGAHSRLKLTSSVSTNNMVMFDQAGALKRYASPEEILTTFFETRMELYVKRRAFLLEQLSADVTRLSNKVRFILAVVAGELVISRRSKAQLYADLVRMKFDPLPSAGKKGRRQARPSVAGDADDDGADSDGSAADTEDPIPVDGATETGSASDYDYLLSMALWSLTAERVAKLTAERDAKIADRNGMEATVPADLWLADLAHLEEVLAADAATARQAAADLSVAAASAAARQAGKGGKGKGKARGGGVFGAGSKRGGAASYAEDADDAAMLASGEVLAPPTERVQRVPRPKKDPAAPKAAPKGRAPRGKAAKAAAAVAAAAAAALDGDDAADDDAMVGASDGDDAIAPVAKAVAKPRGRKAAAAAPAAAAKPRKATRTVVVDTDSDDADDFALQLDDDSGSDGGGAAAAVPPRAAAKPRSARGAARKKAPIVESSDDSFDGHLDDGSASDGGVDDDDHDDVVAPVAASKTRAPRAPVHPDSEEEEVVDGAGSAVGASGSDGSVGVSPSPPAPAPVVAAAKPRAATKKPRVPRVKKATATPAQPPIDTFLVDDDDEVQDNVAAAAGTAAGGAADDRDGSPSTDATVSRVADTMRTAVRLDSSDDSDVDAAAVPRQGRGAGAAKPAATAARPARRRAAASRRVLIETDEEEGEDSGDDASTATEDRDFINDDDSDDDAFASPPPKKAAAKRARVPRGAAGAAAASSAAAAGAAAAPATGRSGSSSGGSTERVPPSPDTKTPQPKRVRTARARR